MNAQSPCNNEIARRVDQQKKSPMFTSFSLSCRTVLTDWGFASVTYAICVSRGFPWHDRQCAMTLHLQARFCVHASSCSAAIIMIMDERTQTVRLIQSRREVARLFKAHLFFYTGTNTQAHRATLILQLLHTSLTFRDTCFRKHNENECAGKIAFCR
jgi:hypothetical protein